MPRHPDKPRTPAPPSPRAEPPAPEPEDTTEGMLDLDDHDQINNQHLEVR